MASVTTDGTTPDGGQGTAALATPAAGVARAPVKLRRVTRREQGTMSWRVRLRRDKALVLMTLPAIVLLGVFGYAPMLGLVMAFQSYDIYNGFLHSPWVGLANFQQLFGDPGFWHAFWNTLALFSVQLLLFFPIPIALAILLDSLLSRKLRSVIQSVVTLPHFFSWVLVVTVFQQMLIQRGAVGPGSAEVLTTFSYEFGIVNGNYSYGAAAGLFLGVTSLVLILAANKVAHLFGEDGLYRR